MRRLFTLFFCMVVAVAMTSCDTNLNKTNPNELTTESFYQNKSQALSGLFSVYDALQESGLYSRHLYFNHDMLSEEAVGTGSLQGCLNGQNTRTLGPSNGCIGNMWDAFYLGVKRANLILEKIEGTKDLSDEERNRIKAEARFLRAFYYYELGSLWGDVPLVTEVKDDVGGIPVTSKDSIFIQVFNDVEYAEQHLPLRSEVANNMLGRATKGAARMLDGRAHLMQGDWDDARAAFQKVIDSGEYSLVDDYFDNFKEETENNAESIFEVQFTLDPGSWNWGLGGSADHTWRRQEYGWIDWNNVLVSNRLYDEFENNDPRRDMSFYEICDPYNGGKNVVLPSQDHAKWPCGLTEEQANAEPNIGHPNKPSWRKYENYYKVNSNDNFWSGINFRVFRLAEAYVGLAEAQVMLGNGASAGNGSMSAADALNKVRSRPSVNMPDIGNVGYNMSNTQIAPGTKGAMTAVFHEYASEFAGEQVLLFPQLRHMRYWEDWAGDEAGEIHRYLPIPQSEVDANPAISSDDQPDGY